MYHPLLKKEVHTPPDAAKVLGLTPVTILDWIRTGKIEAYKIGSRFYISDEVLGRLIMELTTPLVTKQD